MPVPIESRADASSWNFLILRYTANQNATSVHYHIHWALAQVYGNGVRAMMPSLFDIGHLHFCWLRYRKDLRVPIRLISQAAPGEDNDEQGDYG